MPLYEYKCEKCGNRFEKIEAVSASATRKCPQCGGRAERLLTAPAIQFKGTGWYVTDYAGKNSGAAPSERSDGNSSGKASKKSSEPAGAGEKAKEK